MPTDRVTFYALAYGDEQIERRAVGRASRTARRTVLPLAARQGLPSRHQSFLCVLTAARFRRMVNIVTCLLWL